MKNKIQNSFQSFKETNEKAVSTTTEYQKNLYKRLAKFRARKARAEEKALEFKREQLERERKLNERFNFTKEELENEEWRRISREELEGYYVSNLGRVKDKYGKIMLFGRSARRKGAKSGANSKGYYYICTERNGKSITFRVHNLVAEAFLENPFEESSFKVYVNHKDKNTLNNRVSNLEWCSPTYNAKHANNALDEDTKNKKYFDLNSQIQRVNILIKNNEVQDCFIDGNYIIFPTIKRESELLNCSRYFINSKLDNCKRISINQKMYC